MLNLPDDHEIFRGYRKMMDLYNALKFITMLFFIQKILTFNLGVAFLKSVSIHQKRDAEEREINNKNKKLRSSKSKENIHKKEQNKGYT